jgi:SAM-dependent methyltransferase
MHMPSTRGIAPEAARYLEICRQMMHCERHELRVLDFGCGHGEAVLALRELGYPAFGVDIDARQIARGQRELAAAGYDGEAILFGIEENGRLPFPDGTFGFVFSMEVFEHVRVLRPVCAELERVLAPGGYGFHIFRAPRSWQEHHFFMPLVHWLPKNAARRYAIRLYALLGIGLHPREIPNATARERGEFLYRYSIEQTYYRAPRHIGNALRHSGLDVCYVATNHRKLRKLGPLARLLNVGPLQRAATWAIMTFRVVNLLTRKPDPSRTEPRPHTLQLDRWRGPWHPASPRPAHSPTSASIVITGT